MKPILSVNPPHLNCISWLLNHLGWFYLYSPGDGFSTVRDRSLVPAVHAAATHRLTGKIILSFFISFSCWLDLFYCKTEWICRDMQRNNNLGKIKLSIWFVCLSLPSFVPNWWRRTPRILRSLSLGARRWSCRQYISACAYCLTIRMRTCPRPACELRTL